MSPRVFNNEALAREIHARHPEYLVFELQDILEIVPESIEALVAQGHSVRITNLGTFSPKQNKDRYTKHPQTGKWEYFKGNLTVNFKSARSLLDRLKGNKNARNQEVPE